jgi:D-alanyl-D-alanine carboxypeptidase/D-alanyl-D-alanine carboxypeptidase (penicillin-binding protein 5/6)
MLSRCRKLSAAVLIAIFFVFSAIPISAEAEPVAVSAKACVLMDAQSGAVLYARNADEKRPMASTTKIMTTLLTLESGDLDSEFVVDSDAIRVEGSSMGLRAGDAVTKRVLCAGMLLPSGNDAANAAAVAVAGSIPAFLTLMNKRAAEIGMTRTCFATPSGLDAEGHGASARDMALLAREALKNDDFAAICRQKSMRVMFGNPPYARTLYNTNKLLGRDETVIGMKTGFTDAAGRCLVSACERSGRRLICVTLFDRNDWNDHLALYDYGFSGASDFTVPMPDALEIPVEGAEKTAVRLVPEHGLTLTQWFGVQPVYTQTVRIPPFLTAPVPENEPVGELVCTGADGTEITRIRLFSAEEIPCEEAPPPESFWDRLRKKGGPGGK